jgi:hypothetical protein
MIKPPQTRREAEKLKPEILGQYHDLLMTNDIAGFEALLEIYRVPEELREEHRREFTQYAERLLRRKWRGPKWP